MQARAFERYIPLKLKVTFQWIQLFANFFGTDGNFYHMTLSHSLDRGSKESLLKKPKRNQR